VAWAKRASTADRRDPGLHVCGVSNSPDSQEAQEGDALRSRRRAAPDCQESVKAAAESRHLEQDGEGGVHGP